MRQTGMESFILALAWAKCEGCEGCEGFVTKLFISDFYLSL